MPIFERMRYMTVQALQKQATEGIMTLTMKRKGIRISTKQRGKSERNMELNKP